MNTEFSRTGQSLNRMIFAFKGKMIKRLPYFQKKKGGESTPDVV